ncbi:MAG TPA: Rrf2 family transcriptional regulator [Nitratifractor sp.]|nr:Rrf2 family transcriptional regulator [Nitratifractor sp.]
MLLTRASEYALLSLETINRSERPVGSEQIAKELNIPKSFLAKILQNLTKSNILVSLRGAQGGYRLNVEPKEVSLYDIIAAAEGKRPTVFDCISYSETCPNGAIGTCAISPFLAKFQYKIDTYLKNLTLHEIFYE